MLQLVATAYQVLYSIAYQVPFARPFIDGVTSFFASAARQGAGCYAAPGIDKAPRPTQTLQLYSVESCPYSRKVREALSALDLDFEVFPVPRETLAGYGIAKESRFRPQLLEVGGKLQYPFLVDRDRNVLLYESDDIVEYLWSTYGVGASRPRKPICDRLTAWLASFLRPLPHMGWLRTPSKSPQEPLQLFGFEGSAHTRLVREALDTLELPYITFTMAHGSSKRKDFLKRTGGIQYPYMIDPNTGFGSFEAPLLLRYLYHHYQAGPTVSERFFSYAPTNALPSHAVYRGVLDWLITSLHDSFYRLVVFGRKATTIKRVRLLTDSATSH